jgi:hypothetical protein
MKWSDTPLGLGRPGRVVVGQEIDVKYNFCVPVVELTPEDAALSEFWTLDDYSEFDPLPSGIGSVAGTMMLGSLNLIPIPETASEATLTFRNIITDEVKTLTLPELNSVPAGNAGYFLTVFRGMPLLITLPIVGEGSTSSSYFTEPPFLAGKTTIYASNWTAWGKVMDVDPPSILTSETTSGQITGADNSPKNGVTVLGEDRLAVFSTYTKITDGSNERPTTIEARLYDRSFAYVGTKTLTAGDL